VLMGIDRELILKVAKNAKLSLTDEEIEEFVPQFQEVLEAFSKLREVDTEKTGVSAHPVGVRNVVREDDPGECVDRESILSNTKHKKDGYFVGPKAL